MIWRRRGAVLLDAMLAVAIFVSAGSAILVLCDRSLAGLERERVKMQACDLARSAMARIEAGIDSAQALNGLVRTDSGLAPGSGSWELKIETDPSQFTGLTRVSVTALRHARADDEQVVESYTLRQLVRLAGRAEDTPGPDDPLREAQRAPARPKLGGGLGSGGGS
jgi:hypothetical protein